MKENEERLLKMIEITNNRMDEMSDWIEDLSKRVDLWKERTLEIEKKLIKEKIK